MTKILEIDEIIRALVRGYGSQYNEHTTLEPNQIAKMAYEIECILPNKPEPITVDWLISLMDYSWAEITDKINYHFLGENK